MGTKIEVYVSVEREAEATAHAEIDACLAWLGEVDTRLTRFNLASELCQLNAAGGEWFEASELLFAATAESLAAAQATGGLFDPTLLPLLEELGYDRDFAEIPNRETPTSEIPVPAITAEARQGAGNWRHIELDHARGRIRLPRDTRLDLGGIAKGWAADIALNRFFRDGANVIINVGGDLRLRGELQEGEPWPIGVTMPVIPAPTDGSSQADARHAAVLTLTRGGLAASGATDRWWYHGGARAHHVLDPRTGQPAPLWIDAADDVTEGTPLIASATALAPTAAHAEVAAKVALLRGYPDAIQAVEAAWQSARPWNAPTYGDVGVALVLVMGTGEVIYSANLQDYLDTLGGGGDVWVS